MHLRAARIATREDELIMALIFVLSEGLLRWSRQQTLLENSKYAKSCNRAMTMLPKIMRGGRRVSASLMQSEVLLSVRVEMKIITQTFSFTNRQFMPF